MFEPGHRVLRRFLLWPVLLLAALGVAGWALMNLTVALSVALLGLMFLPSILLLRAQTRATSRSDVDVEFERIVEREFGTNGPEATG